jgi:hypothetical protein
MRVLTAASTKTAAGIFFDGVTLGPQWAASKDLIDAPTIQP